MEIFLTIVAVIVIFSVIVLLHEYGHFIMARRAGIKVLEFGIGFPPRIFKKKIGETIYSINAIPIGGFVRLFGEDSTDEEIIKNKRSYAGKTPWVRTKVIVAGVCMNFILAILLLTIGFSFGIEPLLVTEDDLFRNIGEGNVVSAPGIFVAGLDEKAVGFDIGTGDQILAVNEKPIVGPAQIGIFEKGRAEKDIDITVYSKAKGERKIHVPLVGKDNYYGIKLKPYTEFPRIAILEVKEDSQSALAGLKPNDVILQMNGADVYLNEEFEAILTRAETINFTILRGQSILQVPVRLPDTNKVVIAEVFADSAAQEAGFLKGDIVVSIDGNKIGTPEQMQDLLKANPGKEMLYGVISGGKGREVKAKTDKSNMLGVALSLVSSFKNSEISLYRSSVLTSITEIKKVRYAPWTAFRQSVSESVRLTGITIEAFGRTIKSILSHFVVPAEIGGPVQIAYYTHAFVQEGFFALLRFTALLSLSLAVINVLPIPALDGGRLLFILIEIVFKKKVNTKFEALAHSIGFILLLGLIILVTYSDIVKLF